MSRMSATDRERPIAVFDSGVGGLTVLHELLVALPGEDFLYPVSYTHLTLPTTPYV